MDENNIQLRLRNALSEPFPLHFAAAKGDIAIIKELLSRGCLVNSFTFDLVTPLHEAAARGHDETVDFLIKEGASIDAKNIDGATPLSDACVAGSFSCVKILLERQATVNPPMLLTSPLHEAIMRGYTDCARLLIQFGAKLNSNDCHYGTPLHAACAAYKINVDCVALLLIAGADVNATMFHKTPLHIAARRKSVSLVELLLHYGADASLRDNQGLKPSQLAEEGSRIRTLLEENEIKPKSLIELARLAVLHSFVVGKGTGYLNSLVFPPGMLQSIIGYPVIFP